MRRGPWLTFFGVLPVAGWCRVSALQRAGVWLRAQLPEWLRWAERRQRPQKKLPSRISPQPFLSQVVGVARSLAQRWSLSVHARQEDSRGRRWGRCAAPFGAGGLKTCQLEEDKCCFFLRRTVSEWVMVRSVAQRRAAEGMVEGPGMCRNSECHSPGCWSEPPGEASVLWGGMNLAETCSATF